MCCFFFFFLFDETGVFIFSSMIGAGDDSVASVVLFVFSVVVVVTVCLFGEFWGEFFFPPLFWLLVSTPRHLFCWGSPQLLLLLVLWFFQLLSL